MKKHLAYRIVAINLSHVIQSKLLLKQVISIITCMHDISARRYIL